MSEWGIRRTGDGPESRKEYEVKPSWGLAPDTVS